MKYNEKLVQRDIDKYVKTLKTFLKRQSGKPKIKLGKPNDKHLRTYIKNLYYIKLLFPKTLSIELSHNRKEVINFIKDYKRNKNLVIKKATNRLNKNKGFVIK